MPALPYTQTFQKSVIRNGRQYILSVTVRVLSQDVPRLLSYIDWTAVLQAPNGSTYHYSSGNNLKVWLNQSDTMGRGSTAIGSVDLRTSSLADLGFWKGPSGNGYPVTHFGIGTEHPGDLYFTVHAKYWNDNSTTFPSSQPIELEGTFTCPTIPVPSTIASLSGITLDYDSGSTFTIKMSDPTNTSRNYHHRLTINYGSGSSWSYANTFDYALTTITIPQNTTRSIASALGSTKKSGAITLSIQTYNASDVAIGFPITRSVTATMNSTFAPELTVTSQLTESASTYGQSFAISGLSKVKLTFNLSGAAKSGATISKIYVDGTEVSIGSSASPSWTSPVIASSSGSTGYTCRIVDSRGFEASGQKGIYPIYVHRVPSISGAAIYRTNSAGTKDQAGTYAVIAAVCASSSLPNGNAWTAEVTLNGQTSTVTFTDGKTEPLGEDQLSPTQTYVATLKVTDHYGKSTSVQLTIRTAAVTIDANHWDNGNEGVAFGKYAETASIVDSNWAMKFPYRYGDSIPDNSDLNNYVAAGVYRNTASSNTIANVPTDAAGHAFRLWVMPSITNAKTAAGATSALYFYQILMPYNTNDVYTRTMTTSSTGTITFGSWRLPSARQATTAKNLNGETGSLVGTVIDLAATDTAKPAGWRRMFSTASTAGNFLIQAYYSSYSNVTMIVSMSYEVPIITVLSCAHRTSTRYVKMVRCVKSGSTYYFDVYFNGGTGRFVTIVQPLDGAAYTSMALATTTDDTPDTAALVNCVDGAVSFGHDAFIQSAKQLVRINAAGSENTSFPNLYWGVEVNENKWALWPGYDGAEFSGLPSHRWHTVYSVNGVSTTSDRELKRDILDMDPEVAESFIENLRPVTYKLRNITEDDNHDRTHWGLVSQDVEETLADMNLTSEDFGGLCYDDLILEGSEDTVRRYSLRYAEFIAPMIKVIQAQQQKIEELSARVLALESE